MLDDHGIEFRYREYTTDPLSHDEVKSIVKKLGVPARDLLRRNDAAFKELGLTGDESDAKLCKLYSEHPTLMQRPIGVKGAKARIGRPVENLLELR